MDPQPTLPVIVAPEPETADDSKGGLFRPASGEGVLKKIPIEQMQKELDSLTRGVSQLVEASPTAEDDEFRLTQLTVQVEITASGGISLIGTANVGATAAMTLTFSR